MNTRSFAIAVFVMLAGAGCIPEKRIVWTADGSRAAVLADDGLRICDAQGRLGAAVLPQAKGTAWFPDGRQLLCVRVRPAGTWAEAAECLSPKQRELVLAETVKLRAQVLASHGPWDKFEPAMDPALSPGMQGAAVLCLRDVHGQGLREHVGEKWADVEKLTIDVHEPGVVSDPGNSLAMNRTIARSLDEYQAPTVSAGGQAFAFLRRRPKEMSYDLYVASLDGSEPRRVATQVARGYDWSPDGRSLAYLYSAVSTPIDKNTVVLGALATDMVAAADGSLLASSEGHQDRVGVLFNPLAAVRWLRDGRLMFSAHDVTLPATSRDMPTNLSIFAIDPRMGSAVIRLLGRDFQHTFGIEHGLFEVSPDGSRLLLAGQGGRTWLYNIADGAAELLVDRAESESERFGLPVWRTNEEACIVVPAGAGSGSPHRNEIVFWKDAQHARCVSKDWPSIAVQSWLAPARPKTASQPAR